MERNSYRNNMRRSPKPPEPSTGWWLPLNGPGKGRAQSHLWVILASTVGPPGLQPTFQREPLFPAASLVPLRKGEAMNRGIPSQPPPAPGSKRIWGQQEEVGEPVPAHSDRDFRVGLSTENQLNLGAL